jgi:exosome complex component RRP4
VKELTLTDAMALKGGSLLKFSPVKIPRLIGKKNSMVTMIKDATGCDIFIGRNGFVWLSDKGDVSLAKRAVQKVDAEAHIPGLTDRVAAFLKDNKKQ